MANKMTWNEFFETVMNETENETVRAMAKREVEKHQGEIDKKKEKVELLLNALTDELQTANEIAEKTGLSRPVVSSNMTIICKEGNAEKEYVQFAGRLVRGYRLPTED